MIRLLKYFFLLLITQLSIKIVLLGISDFNPFTFVGLLADSFGLIGISIFYKDTTPKLIWLIVAILISAIINYYVAYDIGDIYIGHYHLFLLSCIFVCNIQFKDSPIVFSITTSSIGLFYLLLFSYRQLEAHRDYYDHTSDLLVCFKYSSLIWILLFTLVLFFQKIHFSNRTQLFWCGNSLSIGFIYASFLTSVDILGYNMIMQIISSGFVVLPLAIASVRCMRVEKKKNMKVLKNLVLTSLFAIPITILASLI